MNYKIVSLYIKGMDCASCAVTIERELKKLKGVITLRVNYADEKAFIGFDEHIVSINDIINHLQKIGYDSFEFRPAEYDAHKHEREKELHDIQMTLMICISLYVPIFFGTMMPNLLPWLNHSWFFWLLATPIQFWVGNYLYKSAFRAFKNHTANMNTLIVLGTTVAYCYSVFVLFFGSIFSHAGLPVHTYFDVSAGLITIILLGNYLEVRAKGATSKAIENLLRLSPQKATRLVSSTSGEQQWQEVPLEQIVKGDVLLIKPGDRIPVDGIVTQGESLVDESMITGESIPVKKIVRSSVTGGTMNKRGSFQMRAMKVGNETLLAKIIDLVQRAQSSKAPIEKIVDRISEWFVPLVIIAAIITFLLWFNIGPEPSFLYALISMVSVLMIACPCALGLATPMSIMVGIGRGAQEGILIKDAETLQMAGKVKTMVLDKTGTLTKGVPEVEHILLAENLRDLSKNDILSMLVSLEERSRHPISDAVIRRFGKKYKSMNVESSETIEGLGLKGRIDGHIVRIGSRRFLQQGSVSLDARLDASAQEWAKQAYTVTYMAIDQNHAAVFSIIDPIKKDAFAVIAHLKALGVTPVMLTGDTLETAKSVARQLGISSFFAEVLPQDKQKYVEQLKQTGHLIAMVGDGINDAPALAAADVGIAMGGGTDVAIETASVTLLKSDIRLAPSLILLSRATIYNIHENLFWAFGYNIILIPVAMGVLYPLWGILLNPMVAGFAMTLSSLSVVLNALRLRWIHI
jgi:P-type Cu+ transporter